MNHLTTKVCVFARTSSEGNKSDRQDFERQINELKEYCLHKNWDVAKIIASKVSGTKTGKKREDIKELLDSAKKKEFSKVIICETSRLGRVAKDIRNTIDSLHALKIPIVFKNLGGMESLDESGNESFVTNIIISIYAELAQEEKKVLSERVRSGLREAIRKGKIIGRRKGTIKDRDKLLKEYSKLVKDIEMGLSLQKCMKIHSLSKNTVIKVKKAVNAQPTQRINLAG